MATTRWAWSIESENQQRNLPEHDKAPTNTNVLAPHGVDGGPKPVPLNLLTRRMLDVHVRAALHPRTRLAMRPESTVTDLTGERLIRPPIPVRQRLDFDEQHRRTQMRIIREPLTHIRLDPIERINHLARPDTDLAVGTRSPTSSVGCGLRSARCQRRTAKSPGACEAWSVKDLLAHLHAWHQMTLSCEEPDRPVRSRRSQQKALRSLRRRR